MNSKDKIYQNEGNVDVINNIPATAKYVLDVGCGNGCLADILTKNGHIVDGITISHTEAINAIDICRNVYVHNLENGLPESLNKKYDLVICSHVLEHICYPELLLFDIYNILNDDALLIVALPNIMHIASRFQLFIGNFNYKLNGMWDNTHFKWYTFQTSEDLLIHNNFKIKKKYVTGELPFISRSGYFKNTLLYKYFKNIILKKFPGLFGYQIILVVTK